jgi:hypothetical protein
MIRALLCRKKRVKTHLESPLAFGNPLIMKEMAKHVPDPGSYAQGYRPGGGARRWRAFVMSYDRMASLLAPYKNHDALEVAQDLDRKVEDPLRHAAA